MQDRIDTERLILEFDITNEELANAANMTLYTASRIFTRVAENRCGSQTAVENRSNGSQCWLMRRPGQLGIEGESSCHFFGKICTLFAFPGILV